MAAGDDPVSTAADGLKTLMSRVGEFFHILDLSFIVAGAMTLGAIAYTGQRLGIGCTLPSVPWITGAGVVVACYVCGLLSFALGRLINGHLFRRHLLQRVLPQAIDWHQLSCPGAAVHLGKPTTGLWRLYGRLWQELSITQPGSAAFAHLSRYWGMAATYDGVAVSLLIWAAAVVTTSVVAPAPPSFHQALVMGALLALSAILSLKQGARCYEFQIEDLVAALAAAQKASSP